MGTYRLGTQYLQQALDHIALRGRRDYFSLRSRFLRRELANLVNKGAPGCRSSDCVLDSELLQNVK